MVGYLKQHTIMKLNKPMILGVNFDYKHIKSKYGKRATLTYSDTYSLFIL